MTRQIVVVFALAVFWLAGQTPACAAYDFYVRIQGPKPSLPQSANRNAAVIAFSFSIVSPRDPSGNAITRKRTHGAITIVTEPLTTAAITSVSPGPPSSPKGVGVPAAMEIHEIVTVGCQGFDVQADYGKGPVHGVLAGQSVDGLCIFAVPMTVPAANAIVRIGLPDTPPGWSFNSQAQSKCIRSGDTLDGTLGASQDIFSFQWGPSRAAMLAQAGPCGKP
jgi:hypothetical protein